jgi:hypothetical protein
MPSEKQQYGFDEMVHFRIFHHLTSKGDLTPKDYLAIVEQVADEERTSRIKEMMRHD